MQTISVAASGMDAQTAITSTLANNIANANTTAYKTMTPYLTDSFYNDIRVPASQLVSLYSYPNAVQFGNGAELIATLRNFQQGAIKSTGNEFNIAISGQGFLGVLLPNGQIGYTRDGNLIVDGNTNQLVTATGFPLQPNIVLPPASNRRAIVIDRDGKVSYTDNSNNVIPLGQLSLYAFNNNQGLLATGENVFFATEASGPPMAGFPSQDIYGIIQQNALELSNASPIMNITDLIASLRIYEMNARVLHGGDSMLKTIVEYMST